MRLIDATALAKFIDYGHLNNPGEKLYSENDIREMIDMMPTIDAEPVRHGKWLKAYSDHEAFGIRPFYRYCSCCNEATVFPHNYCPNCGARMDEE